MRQETGEGRSKHFTHLPKKHKDLFLLPASEIKLAPGNSTNTYDTMTRLFGAIVPDHPAPSS